MIEEKSLPALEAPSKGAIVKATVIALAVALLLLVTTVLPAEYGIDPLRTGALLGLTGLSKVSDTATGGAQHRYRLEFTRCNPGSIKLTPRTWVWLRARESRSNITCRKARLW